MKVNPTRQRLLELVGGGWVGQAVSTVARLGIADLLADGPRTITGLADETSTDPIALQRVLRALASIGVFQIRPDHTVELTSLAEPLRRDHPDSLRSFAIMVNQEIYAAFGDLMHSVRTGGDAFTKHFGMSLFEYLDSHGDAAVLFHESMEEWGRTDIVEISENYDFSSYRKVVDIGGGNGRFLSVLLAKYPDLTGVLLDRAAAIEAARAGAGGPLPRCELVTGDFLVEVPAGADLYVLKNVLVDWPDEAAITILQNCRAAMAAGGRLLVLDSVIQDGPHYNTTKWLDILIMVATHGQFRSESEFANLFAKAGLRLNQVISLSASITLLEALPA